MFREQTSACRWAEKNLASRLPSWSGFAEDRCGVVRRGEFQYCDDGEIVRPHDHRLPLPLWMTQTVSLDVGYSSAALTSCQVHKQFKSKAREKELPEVRR